MQPGAMLGNIYQELYKRANVTIPGGTCFTVTAGGHVSGGGYGVLARSMGLRRTGSRGGHPDGGCRGEGGGAEVDATHDPDLFRALRGGGDRTSG